MSIGTFKMLLALSVLAYVFMGIVFIVYQKRGQSFIASFDKAVVWAIGFFVVGSTLTAIA